MKRFLTLVVFVCVLLLAILVGAQNDQLVVVNYLIAQSELRLSVLMAVMFLLGVVISLCIISVFWLRLKWKLRQLERKQKLLTPVE